MSEIKKRIIKELYKGTKLSIKNMYLIRCSNISREIIRQFEEPFDIILNRQKIKWNENGSSGSYYEYSLRNEDYPEVEKLYDKYILGIK